MARPHEDLRHHTLTDHRLGGATVAFAEGTWCAIEIAHVPAARSDAMIAAYETLIERTRGLVAPSHPAAVLRAADRRRVVAFAGMPGHAEFRHVSAVWDDHHLTSEHRAIAHSARVGLYRVTATPGDARVDPNSSDRYVFEHVTGSSQSLTAMLAEMRASAGFLGAIVFAADIAGAVVGLSRFEEERQVEAFRASDVAVAALGRFDPNDVMHVVKTFAA